jgi:DNA-binding Lrp family transcriptional regulator
MTELNPAKRKRGPVLDRLILFELMKNSRRSDRELAKILRVSQPTVTRRRDSLEKNGIIETYTLIPNWKKLGYELCVITLVKIRTDRAVEERYREVRNRGTEWLIKQPNVLMAGGCRGMGVESFMISFHKTYSEYDELMGNIRLKLGDLLELVQSIIVNLAGNELLKPLNPAYIAEVETK